MIGARFGFEMGLTSLHPSYPDGASMFLQHNEKGMPSGVISANGRPGRPHVL